MSGNKNILLMIGAIALIAIVVGSFLSLFQNQQQLEKRLGEIDQTAMALATSGTAEAMGGAAQAATSTAFAVNVTVAVQGTTTAQSAIATSRASTATAQAQSTATAQARASATAQTVYRERIVTRTVGTINKAAELTTAKISIQEVAEIQQSNDPILLVIPNPPTKLTYKAFVDIRAGFDLRAITRKDVEIVGDTVIIRLPPPKILVRSIDSSRAQLYDEDVPWFGKLKTETIERAQQLILKDAMAEACKKEILEQANQNAQTAFENLLFAFEFTKVKVITQPGGVCE
jgi:hypothetical protein